MARLRYISTDEPGYSRKKRGKGFTYLDTEGQTIRDKALRDWIASLAIPPAWTDVWISPYKNGHILVTGRDDKDRKQYIYHPAWRERRNQKKFDSLLEFGTALPLIREVTDEHLQERTISRTRVLAAIVRLLETTLIRIGNEEYARQNDSYGLSTLTDDHVEIEGSKIIFDFVGKSGKEHTIVLRNKELAKVVKQSQDIPGYELFQYYDETGEHRVVDSADVNEYLREITGQSFTAKVFRTWGGSILAINYLCEQGADTDPVTAVKSSIAHVAEALGNTEAITREYYIHPAIMDAHQNGTLQTIYASCQTQKPSAHELSPAEQTLITLIEQKLAEDS